MSSTTYVQKQEWHSNIYYNLCNKARMSLQYLVQPMYRKKNGIAISSTTFVPKKRMDCIV